MVRRLGEPQFLFQIIVTLHPWHTRSVTSFSLGGYISLLHVILFQAVRQESVSNCVGLDKENLFEFPETHTKLSLWLRRFDPTSPGRGLVGDLRPQIETMRSEVGRRENFWTSSALLAVQGADCSGEVGAVWLRGNQCVNSSSLAFYGFF